MQLSRGLAGKTIKTDYSVLVKPVIQWEKKKKKIEKWEVVKRGSSIEKKQTNKKTNYRADCMDYDSVKREKTESMAITV